MTLNRAPDAQGLQHYVALMEHGIFKTYDDVVADMRNSPEYQAYRAAHNGAAPEIVRIYHDELNRDPDPAGGEKHTTDLLNGVSYDSIRATVALAASCQTQIADAYLAAQQLPPTNEQINWAVDYLEAGGSIQGLKTILASPPRSTVIALSPINPEVTAAYLSSLDREPDWTGGIDHSSLLWAGTMTPQQVIANMTAAPGFKVGLNNIYQEILGRDVNASELTANQELIEGGGTVNQVRNLLWTSDECSLSLACGALVALEAPPSLYAFPNFTSVFGSDNSNEIRIQIEGCNTVEHTSIPALGDLMIGRVRNGGFSQDATGAYVFSGKCGDIQNNSLTLTQMDWTNRNIIPLDVMLDTTKAIGVEYSGESPQYLLWAAFDPTIASFQGEYWVSFQCGLAEYGKNLFAASVCAAPLVGSDTAAHHMKIDASRISVVAKATMAGDSSKHGYAASLGKLVEHKGHLYLYFGALEIDLTKNFLCPAGDELGPCKNIAAHFESNALRGVEVQVDPTTQRLYAKGFNEAIPAIGKPSVEVLANIDGYQVISHDGVLIAAGGRSYAGPTGQTCSEPLNLPNCYSQIFAEALAPLDYHGFQLVSGNALSGIPASYYHFMYRPDDGRTVFMGLSFDQLPSPTSLTTPFKSHQAAFVWPDDLMTPICNPVNQPFPYYMERGNHCVPSCGQLRGKPSTQACFVGHQKDAGESYDAAYCCAN